MKNGLLLAKYTAFMETQSILYKKISDYLFIGYTHVVTRNLKTTHFPLFSTLMPTLTTSGRGSCRIYCLIRNTYVPGLAKR